MKKNTALFLEFSVIKENSQKNKKDGKVKEVNSIFIRRRGKLYMGESYEENGFINCRLLYADSNSVFLQFVL